MSWSTTSNPIDYDILTYGLFCTPCLFGENAFSINYINKTMKEELRTIFSKVHFSFKSKNLRTKNTQKT